MTGAGKEEVISYERLYRLWEENNWSATAIDFSRDADDWRDKLDERQRISALWNYSMFLVGEESVARTLTPVMDAAPTHEQKNFIATQIVDEARHHVFFDRFLREVADQGKDTRSTLATVEPLLTWGFREVFSELDRVTQALHDDPTDRTLLASTVALYHLIIEGVLAIPGQHFIQRYVETYDLLPGFAGGITNVSRDESRHVAFGIRFLGDLTRGDERCRDAVVDMLDKVLPWSLGVFVPPGLDPSYTECFGFTLKEIYAFGMRSLDTKLKRVGIDPAEIPILDRQDLSLSYEERAGRAWVLIEAGVLGDDRREPHLDGPALEILFDGVARAVRLPVARSLGGPIQWEFTDAEPWHLVVVDGHAEAKPGRAGRPALTLRSTSGDWAKVAVGRTDAKAAVMARKLRPSGSLRALARLPRLFD